MRLIELACCGVLSVSLIAYADGPDSRKATDPKSVTSANTTGGAPLPVEALLTTTRLGGVTHSHDGKMLAYVSNASGRPNLWVMNIDGTGARQLVKNNDRQADVLFTHDGSAVVYAQDRGGNEYSDIYVVPVGGAEPRNLTNTDDVSETPDEFSPDGKLLAIAVKQKTSPSQNLAVMEWPAGAIRQLTHEADRKSMWTFDAWSPDGKWIYATRSIGLDNADIYRVEVATGNAEKVFEHADKQVISVSGVSRDGSTLMVTSNVKGGFSNVALLSLATKKLRWLTDTQWSAAGVGFTPDGASAVYVLNADGRVSTRFVNLKTMAESERGVPAGMNTPAALPTPFLPDGEC